MCVSYGELTDGETDDRVMSPTTYRHLQQRGQIEIARRGCFGQSALIAYRSLPERYKARFVAKYGDPERLATRSSLRDLFEKDMRAEDFYRRQTTDGYTPLKPELQQLYVNNASVLNTIIDLMAKRTASIRLCRADSCSADIWALCRVSASFRTLKKRNIRRE